MDNFWALRRYCLEPIPEIFEAADHLNQAAGAHLKGNYSRASDLIKQADIPAVAEWTEKLWGAQDEVIHRYRPVENLPPLLRGELKCSQRMPDSSTRKKLIERDKHHCRYCGIPVIRQEVRNRIQKIYPDALRWGKGNKSQHAGFQCLWLTYEHIVPHSRGGDNSIDNMIISCQPCNCAKMNYTLAEIGLEDPRQYPIHSSEWDGLEGFK